MVSALCPRPLMPGVNPPEGDALKPQVAHGVALGRSNIAMHPTGASPDVIGNSAGFKAASRRVIAALGGCIEFFRGCDCYELGASYRGWRSYFFSL